MTKTQNHVSNLSTKPNLDIAISPAVLSELIDILDGDMDIDATMRLLIQEIIDNAKIFINRFSSIYFLREEKIHEFIGLEFRDSETSLIHEQYKFRLVLNGESIGIFTQREVPIDEMYDIRMVIAESQLPEFSEDTAQKD